MRRTVDGGRSEICRLCRGMSGGFLFIRDDTLSPARHSFTLQRLSNHLLLQATGNLSQSLDFRLVRFQKKFQYSYTFKIRTSDRMFLTLNVRVTRSIIVTWNRRAYLLPSDKPASVYNDVMIGRTRYVDKKRQNLISCRQCQKIGRNNRGPGPLRRWGPNAEAGCTAANDFRLCHNPLQ